MPRIVVFSDIHANLSALEAVWNEISRRKPDHLICLGDLVAFGPQPKETLELLRDEIKPSIVLKGNTDRWIIERVWENKDQTHPDPVFLESLQWTADRIGEDGVSYLESLSGETSYDLDGFSAFLCHASPGNDERGIVREALDEMADVIGQIEAAAIMSGHTHLPLRTRVGSMDVLNAGSVGMPFDRDFRPCYLSFFVGNNALQEITICRVSYSRSKSIDLLEHSDIPGRSIFVHRLRTATFSRPKGEH